MNDQKKLYNLIQTCSFVLYETALYLDGHPDCRKALDYYNRYREKLEAASRTYENRYGPLTIYGNRSDGDRWEWVETPWPWEYEEERCKTQTSGRPSRNSRGNDCGCRR